MEPTKDEALIQALDLCKSFGRQEVLRGMGLEVRRGETVAVMGRSGTGKSVLLKLLIGLQTPDSGTLRMLGRETAGISTCEWNEIRKKAGFLFQQAALYDSLSVEENVAFPISRHTQLAGNERKHRAQELLASVGMQDGFGKLPSEISGGMQKRVGLARALALDPEILLFDEPTAGLDPITSDEIGKLIVDLKKSRGITAVVVTHDVRTARAFADRVVLINEGKVAVEGTFGELQGSRDSFVKQFLSEGG